MNNDWWCYDLSLNHAFLIEYQVLILGVQGEPNKQEIYD